MGTLTIYYNGTSTSRYTETRTSYPSIYYNPATTARFTFSPTSTSKTIGCSGKVMRSNLVIGGKTIACSGKMMRSDVKVTYTPAVSKPSITNLPNAAIQCVGSTIGTSYAIFSVWKYFSMLPYIAYNQSGTQTQTSVTYAASSYPNHAASKVGNYALYSGGRHYDPDWDYDDRDTNYVQAINTSLTATTPTAMSVKKAFHAGGYNSFYAIFTGGPNNNTIAYNSSLTRSLPAAYNTAISEELMGTNIGSYALFAGGHTTDYEPQTSSSFYTNTVVAYNTSLVKTTPTSLLRTGRTNGAATTNGSYALFAGGYRGFNLDPSRSYEVDAYNSALTRTNATNLTKSVTNGSAAGVAGAAFIAGGYGGAEAVATVDVYNASLSKSSATALSVARYNLGSASIGSRVIFAGGYSGGNSGTDRVDSYLYT